MTPTTRPARQGAVLLLLVTSGCALPMGLSAPDQPGFEGLVDGQIYGPGYRLEAVTRLPVRAIAVDSALPGFPKERLADGLPQTQWINGRASSPSALATLDLGAPMALASLLIKTGPSAPGTRYDVQVSADGQAYQTVLAACTNTSWGVETKSFPARTTGRYLRVSWHNNPARPTPHFAIFDLGVTGGALPAAPPPPPPASPPPAVTPGPASGGGTPPGPVNPPPVPPIAVPPVPPVTVPPVPPVAPPPVPPAAVPPVPPVTVPPAPLPGSGPLMLGFIPFQPKVAQFRPAQSRLRIDLPSEVAAGVMPSFDSIGPLVVSRSPTLVLKGHASVLLAGTTTPITSAPIDVASFAILPGSPPGQIAGGGTDFLELAWPSLNPKLPAGPPIVRVQLGEWSPGVGSGTALDVRYDLEVYDADGNALTRWDGAVDGLVIP